MKKLGIIAGSGALPVLLAQEAEKQECNVFVVALKGFANPEDFHAFPCDAFSIGQGGAILRTLKKRGITHICLVGGVRRPSFFELRPDFWTVRFFLCYALSKRGDNAALCAIRDALAAEGFTLVAIQDFLPQLLAPLGPLASRLPTVPDQQDITRGQNVCKALGALDVGQACVVQEGLVLGVEGIEGTDALIDRCKALARVGRGPILVKMAKPQQDRALDLPTIGPHTIERLVSAGFSGLAIEAGAALIVNLDQVRASADDAGLFVVGI